MEPSELKEEFDRVGEEEEEEEEKERKKERKDDRSLPAHLGDSAGFYLFVIGFGHWSD